MARKWNSWRQRKRKVVAAFTPNDKFFYRAKAAWYRARSAFKLIEIQEKFRIFDKNQKVLDLKQEIIDAIFYERYIELFNTAVGSGFFDRRRINQLQIGTFRHLPVPATELEVLTEALYTLGGTSADPTGLVPHYNISAVNARTDDSVIPTFN